MWVLLDYHSKIATQNIRTALDMKNIATLQHYHSTYENSKIIKLTIEFFKKY